MTTPPTGPVVPGPDPHDAGRRRHRTGWIVATVILALAVIGLLIWALSTQSDLDSANTTIEAQHQAAAKAGENAKQTGQNAQEASASAKQSYDDVSSDLAAEKETNAQLQSDVNQAEKDKAKAKESAAQANTETDKAKAETDKAKAETDTAKAEADAATSCAQGAVNAFGAIFEGDNLRDGVDQAVARLKELKGTCTGPLSGG